MRLSLDSERPEGYAWDCDPDFIPPDENIFTDIDLEDDTGDWQIIALDRGAEIAILGYGAIEQGFYFSSRRDE